MTVCAAMDHYRDIKKEDARFRSIVNNIGANTFKVEDKEVVDFLVNSMLFINAVVQATEDLEFRIHLRNEFFALDFGHIFEVFFFFPLFNLDITLPTLPSLIEIQASENQLHSDASLYF